MTLARLLVSVALLGLAACDTESPTMVVADNDYPGVPEGGDPSTEMTVFKGWWAASLMPDPIRPGEEGQAQRTVPSSDFAYAVLAPGWDPSTLSPPTRFIAMKSAAKLDATRGDTLHVRVSNDTFVGNCAAGKPLSRDDADFITGRIFPAEFQGFAYDAASCTMTALPREAGEASADDDAPDAGSD